MNDWKALGRFVSDPEISYSQGGVAIAKYTLAIDRIGVKEGQQQADFIPCTSLGKTAERIGNSSLKKGHRMLVTDAQLQSWKSEKDGVTKYGMSVLVNRFQFVEKKESAQGNLLPDDNLPADW